MKKQFKNWLILVMLGIAIITGSGIMRGVEADKIDAKAAYMIDAGTGQVLYQQNANSKYPIASLTKILTLAVIMKDIHNQKLSWDQKIKVNKDVSDMANNWQYSNVQLNEGESYTVKSLVESMMIVSADGSTEALALADAGSVKAFNEKMKEVAHEAGVTDAEIYNMIGLPNSDLGNLKLKNVGDDQEDVAQTFRDYDFLALPVTDYEDHLLGIVTVDDIIDVIDDEAASDYSGLAGVNVEEVNENPVKAASRRLPWLITLLFLGMTTATLINHYEALVSKASILAVFISLITGTAGNAGTQSLAVAVRRLAISDDSEKNFGKLVVGEILTGLVTGLVTGITIFIIVGIWKHNFILGFVIGAAMMAAITVATLAGSWIPMIMERLGFDPAVASGPFITTLSDLTSVLIYFNIASLFMERFIGQ